MFAVGFNPHWQHVNCIARDETNTPTLACQRTAACITQTRHRRLRSHALVAKKGAIGALNTDVVKAKSDRTFILAVDDGPDSEYAVHWAAQQLHRAGDTFKLVHCIPGIPPGQLVAVPGAGLLRMPRVDPALLAEKALAVADDQLAKKFSAILENAGVQGSFEILMGYSATSAASGAHSKASISSRLCATAAAEGASAVVIASASKGGLQEMLYGSVAANLVHNCEVPVIVLHRAKDSSSSSSSNTRQALKDAEVAWLLSATAGGLAGNTAAAHHQDTTSQQQKEEQGQHAATLCRSVVVAVDDSDEGYAAVAWVIQHLWRPGDVLHVLHVVPALPAHMTYSLAPDGMMYSLPLPQLEDAQVEESHWRNMLLKRLSPLLESHNVDFQLNVITDYGADPVQGIAGTVVVTAEKLGAAALVVSGHSQGTVADWLMGSVSDFAAHHAGVPVVVLHGPQFARDS